MKSRGMFLLSVIFVFSTAILTQQLLAAPDPTKSQMPVQYAPAEECLKQINYVLTQPTEIIKEFLKYAIF